MGKIGLPANRNTAPAPAPEPALSAAQAQSVLQARDYNEEVYRDFSVLLSETYDDRAYTDPYFDTDEYEDTMDDLLSDIDREIASLRQEADRTSYRYWSEDYQRENTLAAAKLEELADNYRRDYKRQKMNSRRY